MVTTKVSQEAARARHAGVFFIYVNLKVNKYNTTFCAVHCRNRHDGHLVLAMNDNRKKQMEIHEKIKRMTNKKSQNKTKKKIQAPCAL